MPPDEPHSRFLRACRGLETDMTPIWLMRQAGRYMPEYRKMREKWTLLEMIRTPELAAEVTLLPLRRFAFDAAILFSDLLPPLAAMGLGLEFIKDEGPRIPRALSTTRDIDLLPVPSAEETLPETLKTITLLKPELKSLGVPLIGFAGAPFTLASYAIEGGGSKTYEKTRTLMYSQGAAWQRLMRKLVTFQTDYLMAQVKAGADAIQVFDSWAGILSKEEYVEAVQPFNRMLLEALSKTGVPVIQFSTRTSAYLEEVAACGGDVIGVDSQLPLNEAWTRIGAGKAIQGNLDPLALFAPWKELQFRIDRILDQAAGRPGHIFNLGHGLLPTTPVDQVERLVEYVHERTSQNRPAASLHQPLQEIRP